MARSILLFLLVAAAACASAKKSFEKAREAEAAGRWEEAADLYIDALRRDAEYPGAREGLEIAGGRAIGNALELAGRHEGSGRLEDAAREYARVDALVARAASVRVALPLPDGYAEVRTRIHRALVEERLARADELAAQGRHESAAAAYRAATQGLDADPEQASRARKGRYESLMPAAKQAFDTERWDHAGALADEAASIYGAGTEQARAADALLLAIDERRFLALLDRAEEMRSEGRFQEAYAVVNEALLVYGEDAEMSADARALRDRIVAEGTQLVAVLPAWRTDRVRNLPAGLLDDVNDALEEQWAEPPLFVAAVDARLVRGEMRRLGFDRLALSARQAQTVGQMVSADFAVVANVRRARFDGRETPRVQVVKTRDGNTAEILVYDRRFFEATCEFTIVRVADGRVIADGTVTADAERRLRHAAYDGDTGALLLTQEQHRWLDPRRTAEADREILREAAAGLAEGLASAAIEKITDHLP